MSLSNHPIPCLNNHRPFHQYVCPKLVGFPLCNARFMFVLHKRLFYIDFPSGYRLFGMPFFFPTLFYLYKIPSHFHRYTRSVCKTLKMSLFQSKFFLIMRIPFTFYYPASLGVQGSSLLFSWSQSHYHSLLFIKLVHTFYLGA